MKPRGTHKLRSRGEKGKQADEGGQRRSGKAGKKGVVLWRPRKDQDQGVVETKESWKEGCCGDQGKRRKRRSLGSVWPVRLWCPMLVPKPQPHSQGKPGAKKALVTDSLMFSTEESQRAPTVTNVPRNSNSKANQSPREAMVHGTHRHPLPSQPKGNRRGLM